MTNTLAYFATVLVMKKRFYRIQTL